MNDDTPRYLDLATWPRRQLFELFRTYDQPFFNLCVQVDVAPVVAVCSRHGHSFNLAIHYLSLRAVNDTESFRYRLRGDRVLVHPRVHCGGTMLLPDERFVFWYQEMRHDFATFQAEARAEMERLAAAGSLEPADDRDDLIHYSSVPWLSFTGLAHARKAMADDSIPKLVFGKYFGETGTDRILLPHAIDAHHALMDGLHAARYVARFEALCAGADVTLG